MGWEGKEKGKKEKCICYWKGEWNVIFRKGREERRREYVEEERDWDRKEGECAY